MIYILVTANSGYIERILQEPRLRGALFYSVYPGTRAYRDLTLLTIAKALGEHAHGRDYQVTVIIDDLLRHEARQVAVGLRRMRVPAKKVRGARDESNALVLLADALAGFLRDSEEGSVFWHDQLERAHARGMMQKV